MIEDMSAVSTGSAETSWFHGLSFGKILHAPAFVPGPGVDPLVPPLDPLEPPLDPPPPSPDDEEPHAATRAITQTQEQERISTW